MDVDGEMLKDQEERLTGEILRDPNKTLPGLMFAATDRVVRLITRRKAPLPWYFSLIVLTLVSQLPTLLLTIVLGEAAQWREKNLGLIWMGYIELGLLATVLTYIDVLYLYRSLKEHILDAIQSPENLKDLQHVLDRSWSVKYAMYFTVPFTIFWCASFSLVNSLYIKQFIGFGLLSGTIVFGFLAGPALYMLGWLFFLINHLGTYTYNLNDTSPAHSEVILRLNNIFTTLLYSIAIFIAFATLAVANNIGSVFLVVLIGWAPTTVYFLRSQSVIKTIIVNAKWRTLNRIQQQIKALSPDKITDKDTIETINRLMDLHDRIRSTPDSIFNIGTGLNFLNQLALPLLGLLLASIEKLPASIEKILALFR